MPQEDSGERRSLNKFKATQIEGPGWDVANGTTVPKGKVGAEPTKGSESGQLEDKDAQQRKTKLGQGGELQKRIYSCKPDLYKTNHRISKAYWYNRKSPPNDHKTLVSSISM